MLNNARFFCDEFGGQIDLVIRQPSGGKRGIRIGKGFLEKLGVQVASRCLFCCKIGNAANLIKGKSNKLEEFSESDEEIIQSSSVEYEPALNSRAAKAAGPTILNASPVG